MAKASKIANTISLEGAFDEFSYTSGRLRADSLTKHLAEEFDTALRGAFWAVLQQEFNFRESLQAAFALIGAGDDNLNQVSDTVIKVVMSLSKNGFQDPLYKLYCGAKRPYEFKEPILGEQLESVRAWVISMRNPAAAPELQALADPVEQVVSEADHATATRDKTQRESADFRTFGARKLFIDALNQQRESLYKNLEKLRDEHKLAADYPEKFFRRLRAKSQTESKIDKSAIREEIVLLEQQLAEKKSKLVEIETQEQEQQKADAEIESLLAAAAESQRLAEEAQKRAAEIRAKYAKK